MIQSHFKALVISADINLVLIRGLPGAGKSTLGAEIVMSNRSRDTRQFEADQYFMEGDDYNWVAGKHRDAHADCRSRVKSHLSAGGLAVVSNTFTRRIEIRRYADLSDSMMIISLYDNGQSNEQLAQRNIHGVSLEVIANMRARWETWTGEIVW